MFRPRALHVGWSQTPRIGASNPRAFPSAWACRPIRFARAESSDHRKESSGQPRAMLRSSKERVRSPQRRKRRSSDGLVQVITSSVFRAIVTTVRASTARHQATVTGKRLSHYGPFGVSGFASLSGLVWAMTANPGRCSATRACQWSARPSGTMTPRQSPRMLLSVVIHAASDVPCVAVIRRAVMSCAAMPSHWKQDDLLRSRLVDPSSLTNWSKRTGEEEVEWPLIDADHPCREEVRDD